MNYSNITINDPNFIKRFLQRSRFTDAIKLYPTQSKILKVLDFGGGDGELCLRLLEVDSDSNYICYEPAEDMNKQAKQKLSGKNKISLINTTESITENSIDIIFSLEVFEHLPEQESLDALERIDSILKPGGTLIIGVPNELFCSALYKGIFRMFRRFGEFDAQPKNILNCIIGKPPKKRPTGEISPGQSYHSHHLGFDHRLLAKKLTEKFDNYKRVCTPFGFLGVWASPEIYYAVTKVNRCIN